MSTDIFNTCHLLRHGMVCANIPPIMLTFAQVEANFGKKAATISQVGSESLLLRSILEECKGKDADKLVHVHYDTGINGFFGEAPLSIPMRNEDEIYFPFDQLKSDAKIQFSFEMPLKEIPVGSLVAPVARQLGECGNAFLRAGEYHLQKNEIVNRISFQVLLGKDKSQPYVQIVTHSNIKVSLGKMAFHDAFEKVYPVFQSVVLAK